MYQTSIISPKRPTAAIKATFDLLEARRRSTRRMHRLHVAREVAVSPCSCVLFVGAQGADFGLDVFGVDGTHVCSALGFDEVVLEGSRALAFVVVFFGVVSVEEVVWGTSVKNGLVEDPLVVRWRIVEVG